MSTTTTNTASETAGDQRVVLRGVAWKGYTAILKTRGERTRPRIVYLDGDLFLMSPDFSHEYLAENLGDLVKVVGEELEIPYVRTRSTTFRRRKTRGGVEADYSFYLANAARIAGKTRLHLRVDPPPDLVIEAENTHDADPSVEVWRRFGVPEIWVCNARALRILALQPDGNHVEVEKSVAFPFLSAAEIFEWASRPQLGNDLAWIKALRQWVREVLVPRARGLANDGGRA